MATLFIAKENRTIENFQAIKEILNGHGILIEQWQASRPLDINSSQEEILASYAHELTPFMQAHGYATADVINVHPKTENLMAIREKFMKEHTHSEDEIRFFVDGSGKFWFHLENGDILCVTCTKGDFMSVPKNFKHWFDLAPDYSVKAIRIFSNIDGWVPHYTNSGIDASYNP